MGTVPLSGTVPFLRDTAAGGSPGKKRQESPGPTCGRPLIREGRFPAAFE